ncbi:CheR family methyltransferase [Sagittula salina]|uniref:PAS domain-containing protein n=1 Tax=Sagittula salina TaxID=2820268 RepID=A0A940MNJ7_9RHOB|nr:CheR family methyltransferase [Sagittula salina]MBP0485185.1 PAS domain-containing protein [Sagittula salina]
MTQTFPIVGVGASAGGLEALRVLFSGHDHATGMAFVVVQHLDPNHESLMAQLIERYTAMRVTQVAGGELLEPDHIYVIPPGHGLAVRGETLHLTEFVDPRGLRRPIDDFFESLAVNCGPRAACVILSGTGADGTRGLRAIKEHGGLCVVQEPETAAYSGMPDSAIGTGLTDFVAPPEEILSVLGKFFEFAQESGGSGESREILDYIGDICEALSDALGHDFSLYKRSTLSRRIARRMQVLGIEAPKDYVRRLRADPEEATALFHDLLINVTRFFRDPEEFTHLDTLVLRPLVERCSSDDEIRIWIPGCSSGEEAYSLAMLLHDAMQDAGRWPLVQIFATDIDGKMLDIARAGAYPLSALPDIPERFRNRYTVAGSTNFTITQSIRDMVRFSMHSLIKDPPFSKVDLVSCRNLLIYFDETLQRQVVPLLHFALREDGHLFLGSSEAIGRFEDIFRIENQSARIFRRGKARGNYGFTLPKRRLTAPSPPRGGKVQNTAGRRVYPPEIEALRRLAEGYAPVSMVLDEGAHLLHRFGDVGRFLDFPDRTDRKLHVPSLAKPGLREVIGGLVRNVVSTNRRMKVPEVMVRTGLGTLPCTLLCEPLDEGTVLVVIRESGDLDPSFTDGFEEMTPGDGHVRYLEQELQSTRHRLHTAVEELETTNEELKSSNEEMMSMNEELQSTNEELTTVNDELKTKVDQLTVANADLSNFFNSTELVVVVVDGRMRLRSYTEAAAGLFGLDSTQIGETFSDGAGKLDRGGIMDGLKSAVNSIEAREFRIHSRALGQDFVGRALPYKRQDGEYDGATLVLADVTEVLRLERDLEEERERLRLALEVARIGIWEYEPETDNTRIDETERSLLDLGPEDGDRMEPILARLADDDRDRVNRALRQAMDGTRDFDEVFSIPLREGGTRWLHGMGRRFGPEVSRKFIGVTYDVTAERNLLNQRELMIREMNHRVKNLFAIISALISICAREAVDLQDFAISLRSRIRSLAESHALTNAGAEIRRARLWEIMETVLRPAREDQKITLTGDNVEIGTEQLTSLALILHEWGTNATKYGALSVADGMIEITSEVAGDRLKITWQERGIEEAADVGSGFGKALIQATALQLQAEASGKPTSGGYRRELSFPYSAA